MYTPSGIGANLELRSWRRTIHDWNAGVQPLEKLRLDVAWREGSTIVLCRICQKATPNPINDEDTPVVRHLLQIGAAHNSLGRALSCRERDEAAPSHRWEGTLDPHGEVDMTLNLGGNGGGSSHRTPHTATFIQCFDGRSRRSCSVGQRRRDGGARAHGGVGAAEERSGLRRGDALEQNRCWFFLEPRGRDVGRWED
jgi:hypothetical protein